jgi:hypothetical protein
MAVVSLKVDWKVKSTDAAVLEISRVKSDKEYEVGAHGSSARASSVVGAARMAVGSKRVVMLEILIFDDV